MGAKALFVDILYCSRLALQSLALVTKTVVKRRKAKSTFKKTLILEGISPKVAEEITKKYPDPITEFLFLIKNSR